MDRMKGKVALVTGAASGMGKCIASLFAREGARVALADINEAGGKEAAGEIRKNGGDVFFIRLDVTSEEQWKEAVSLTVKKYGRLTTLVNCAGVFFGKSIEEMTFAEWRKVIAINLDGVFLGIKYSVGEMKKTGGSIINISSAGGIIGTVNSSPYNASKGGVRLLTKAAAMEFSKNGYDYNIRVNSVHPGVIKTPMTEWLQKGAAGSEAILKEQPIGYFGEPEDVAYGVLYLASDEGRYLTGSELVIDGGWTAH
ncbi:MAG TPA: glucose 1-dehydrogenase [Dehalococcoidales bacterium]|nr:glucose 1-dehydrogenase [Dehalococcoidales bacterium]